MEKRKKLQATAAKTPVNKPAAASSAKLPKESPVPAAKETAVAAPASTALPLPAEGPKLPLDNMTPEQKATLASLILKTGKQCLVVEFTTLPNGELSCTEKVPLRYTKRDCASGSVQEIGETDGWVACTNKRHLELRFRTSTDAIHLGLRVKRKSEGRGGMTTTYAMEDAFEEEGSLTKLLPAPVLVSISGETPEESPLKLKVSGFATLEWEKTHNFGYDGSSALPNFGAHDQRASQSNFNFFTNFGLEASRDKTSFVSLFEVGELYFGDVSSGGGQGARATNIFEVRNLYLNHAFSDKLGLKGGVVTTNSDPRSFIFSDHVASIQATYTTDLSEGLIWYAEGSKNRPAAAHKRDQYIGGLGTLGFLTGLKATLFGISRQKDSDDLLSNDGTSTVLTGDSRYYWGGATLEGEPLPGLSLQGTAIGNWVKTKLESGSDSFHGHLLDLRISQSWANSSLVTSLEGLTTSGAKGVTDTAANKQIRGKRKNFVSPVAAAYLLSIATSDGVDDSPGSPKESIIGNLNLDEGLRVLVAGINTNLTRKVSGFLRYGYLLAGNGSAATGKKTMGSETDLGLVYQITPSTSLQLDYGAFMPGDFFDKRATARLAATKMKFSF